MVEITMYQAITDLPAPKRAGIGDDGTIYVPVAGASRFAGVPESEILARGDVASHEADGRHYAPAEWLKREYPKSIQYVEAMERWLEHRRTQK
jgi:hypothetical protein